MNTQINISHKQLFKMSLLGLLAALLLIAFTGNKASAQDKTLTLKEAIDLGLQNSKTLKYSQAKIDEAVSQYKQAKDKSLPTGSVSFAYDRAQIPANTLDFGKQTINLPTGANAYLGIASVNEVIFGGNKLKYARQSTDLLTQASRLDADKDKDQITFDIISSYYNLYKVLQSIKVVNQNIATEDQQIHQSQRFFDQGLVTKNDVLRFELQKANIQLNGIDLENNRKVINYNLNVLLGLPETTTLNIDTLTDSARIVGPLSAYLDTALQNRQELRVLDFNNRVADLNIKSIKANQLPTLSASAAGYYVDVAANPLPTHGNYITPLVLGVTVAWNFDALWLNKNKVAQASIQRTEVDINKGITTDNVKDEVNQNYQNYLTALDKIKLLQTSIAQAGENNNILQSKYKSNTASATDRADAETLLFQAQINLELAKADAVLAYYSLLKSTGKLNK
ncbi:Outer membrane protein TolC [Mucilaginibacter mallensis]|uniref:Outer membrane protein TolC n=1 Tax=Mucilaginibacter mallensis TaxID=652787 RepID=A0A1H1MXM0_MUCMA|nr:TolC family protein [Mucilaginibacter mallensis]SDR91526.1 Outer membrane protein TolC [Mucilaginibacter mallensis]